MPIINTINTIDIHWSGLFKPIPGLKTDVQNRIRIKREVIPIIFVPGIMGSRLRRSGDKIKAWDPDDPIFMLDKFGKFTVTAAKRKALLVGKKFNAAYLEVASDDATHNRKFADPNDKTRAERGWGGVFWGSYGPFLKALQAHQWTEPVGHCFEFPVHAFGYNWSASNDLAGKALAREIDRVIDHYRNGPSGQTPRECRSVILITHSMGGLVARAACKLHGAEAKVLGVIHGVQPATGSPAAYWRMKAGFERPGFTVAGDSWWRFLNPLKLAQAAGRRLIGSITAATLGTNGEEVTSLLANMPGGLQLLPSHLYRDNGDRRDWLTFQLPDGSPLHLPKSDPYGEIYLAQDKPWQMVNPDWIDPGTNGTASMRPGANTSWAEYEDNLDEARFFHHDLGDRHHHGTVQFYATGIASPDRVSYTRRHLAPGPSPFRNDHFTNKGEYRSYLDPEDRPLPSSAGATALLTLEMPAGSGDGTVPDSSGRALPLPPDRTVAIGDYGSPWDESPFERGHEGIYTTGSAREIVFRAIVNLALKRIEDETGCVEPAEESSAAAVVHGG